MKMIPLSLSLRLKNDQGWVYNARDFAVMIVPFRGCYHVEWENEDKRNKQIVITRS